MYSLKNLRKEISQIRDRNKRVESDKAWETSAARKIVVMILTYIIIVITLYVLNLPNPFMSAIIPTVAFFLSTLTIPLFKNWWLNNIYKK